MHSVKRHFTGPGTRPWPPAALLPLSILYGLGAWLHRRFYELFGRKRLGAKVIVVGNLTTGGTGKTPVVMDVARRLSVAGRSVAILSRGYGARGLRPPKRVDVREPVERVGDEPYLMAKKLPGVPVWVDPKRSRSGALAAQSAEVLVLDDGFQHHALESDYRVLLVDAQCPFGNGKLLPAGSLREPVSALGRATHIVLTHSPDSVPEGLLKTIRQYNREAALYRCYPRAQELLLWPSFSKKPLEALKGQTLGLFCGLAHPEYFLSLAEASLGARVGFFKNFRDHHWFSGEELLDLQKNALRTGVHALLTTQKDAVRLLGKIDPCSVPIYVLSMELEWPEGFLDFEQCRGASGGQERVPGPGKCPSSSCMHEGEGHFEVG